MVVKLNRESYGSHGGTRKRGELCPLKRAIHVRLPRIFFFVLKTNCKALALAKEVPTFGRAERVRPRQLRVALDSWLRFL